MYGNDSTTGVSTTWAIFDLVDGTTSALGLSTTSSDVSMTYDTTSSGYRCSLTFATIDSGGVFDYSYLATSTDPDPVISGDSTSGINIWGSMVELGSDVSGYIKTESVTSTRTGEVSFVGDGYIELVVDSTTAITTVESPWVDNGNGTYSINGDQTGIVSLYTVDNFYNAGTRYHSIIDVIDISAGSVRKSIGDSTSIVSSWIDTTGFHAILDISESLNRQYIQADADFIGTVRWVSYYEVNPITGGPPATTAYAIELRSGWPEEWDGEEISDNTTMHEVVEIYLTDSTGNIIVKIP